MCYLGAPDVKTILLEDILATVSAKTALISYYVAVGSSCCGNYPTGGYSGYCIINKSTYKLLCCSWELLLWKLSYWRIFWLLYHQ